MKKLLAMLLVAAILVPALIGCGDGVLLGTDSPAVRDKEKDKDKDKDKGKDKDKAGRGLLEKDKDKDKDKGKDKDKS